ncbi:MAG: hypothetical protein DCC75_00425 [Proteobacteria bacterium]|nr:MAG: hypothetical protein DCC75_00425 [Pseudomonadota bacterium]
MLKNFRTYQLAVNFYRQSLCQKLPSELRSQFTRAASSIALNLAEGAGRRTNADQKRFFQIAMGSLRECQAILDLAYLAEHPAKLTADALGAHIYKLIRSYQ